MKKPLNFLMVALLAILTFGIILNMHFVAEPERVLNDYSDTIAQVLDDVIAQYARPIVSLSNKNTYSTYETLIRNNSAMALQNNRVAYIVRSKATSEPIFVYDPYNIINSISTMSNSRSVTSKVMGSYELSCFSQFNYSAIANIFCKLADIITIISPVLIILIAACIITVIHFYKKELPASQFNQYNYITIILIGILIPVTVIALYRLFSYSQIEPNMDSALVFIHATTMIIISIIIALCINLFITQTISRAIRNNKYLDAITCAVVYVFLVAFCYAYFPNLVTIIVAVLLFLLYFCYAFFALKKTSNNILKIHNNPTNSELDNKYLFGEFKIINNNLIGINDGFSTALENSIKNERLRSELITNVSHDIKTPLTSIINYVDLLKNPDLDKETSAQYIEVLDRQSNRLKKLITDLIDASKASTGQVKIEPVKCNLGIMAEQLLGEYSDRLSAANLSPATVDFPKDLFVMADTQCLFRCMDNILSNICKYSLAGTRVYVDFLRNENDIIITFKNISREKLSCSPDELMERFVRGDASRNTEGSGLGLSIVASLMKLMNGELILEIDGDLFKAALRFSDNTV